MLFVTSFQLLMLTLILQAENQTKTATMEKQKGNVAVAIKIQKALNPEKLKLPEFLAQRAEKQERLDELSKLHPELQQVFWQSIVSEICCVHVASTHSVCLALSFLPLTVHQCSTNLNCPYCVSTQHCELS